jgi:formiminotetrahydrofolate cyclodeaminase
MDDPGHMLAARVSDLLEEIADESRLPGGGAVTALVVAMAAGLCAMAARASRASWTDASGVAAQAESIRARAARLAQANTEAFGAAMAALEEPGRLEERSRDHAIGQALERAADLPLAIAEAASDVAELGALIAAEGDPALRPDVVVATRLAEGAARAAEELVSVNLAMLESDARVEVARKLATAAARASERAGA